MSELKDFNLDRLLETLAEKIVAKLTAEPDHRLPRLMTVEQAAAYLGRTKEAVQHLISQEKLPTVRADRRVFLDRADLDKWIDDNKTGWV